MHAVLPNLLTLSRIALVPFVVLTLLAAADAAAACLFAAGMATDVLDGYLARSRGWISTFGELMDPIADKLLVGGAFVALAATNRIAAWAVVLIFGREIAVSGLRMIALRDGTVISASRLGKAKTAVQVVAILVLVLAPDPGAPLVQSLVLLTVAVTTLSGLAYFRAYLTRDEPRTAVRARPAPAHR